METNTNIPLHSRRKFLAGTAATLGTVPLALSALPTAKEDASPQAILALFKGLPGELAIKIHAPATNGKPEFLVESNASKMMFVGSAIKTFVLCEALRQADSPKVVRFEGAHLQGRRVSLFFCHHERSEGSAFGAFHRKADSSRQNQALVMTTQD